MPMPHRTFAQLLRRRLAGVEGSARLRVLEDALGELPDYRNGPYADLRKWINEEIGRTQTRKRAVHRDSIAVPREGAAQLALVGPPNAGKSSLLEALSGIQIRTGDYAFTTTRPLAATTRVNGILVQLVEIPGLLEGAHDGRGGGRALLGVLRGAAGIVYCHALGSPAEGLEVVRAEVEAAGIDLPSIVAGTKADDVADPTASAAVLTTALGAAVVPVSVLDDSSLDDLRTALWSLTGLIRVDLRRSREDPAVAFALRPPATVLDAARAIHSDLARNCTGASVWGPSARFPGQVVGPDHEIRDGDEIIIRTRRPDR